MIEHNDSIDSSGVASINDPQNQAIQSSCEDMSSISLDIKSLLHPGINRLIEKKCKK